MGAQPSLFRVDLALVLTKDSDHLPLVGVFQLHGNNNFIRKILDMPEPPHKVFEGMHIKPTYIEGSNDKFAAMDKSRRIFEKKNP